MTTLSVVAAVRAALTDSEVDVALAARHDEHGGGRVRVRAVSTSA